MRRINYYPPLYKNNFYHVFNRGNGTEKIFYTKENYSYFFQKFRSDFENIAELYAFCFLPNHFHMLIKVLADSPEQISNQFRELFISYSMSINKQQKRKGSLFQRRFKRKWIDDEAYLMRVIYYIHSNPVHHNICDRCEEYPYSSYKLITGGSKLINFREVLGWYNGLSNFKEFHKTEISGIINSNFVIE